MFDHLVTPSGTKIAHAVPDLAVVRACRPAPARPVLRALSRERILRPTGDAGGDRYEIYHDVLAGAVLAWHAQHEAEALLGRERVEARQRQRRLAIIAGISLAAFALMAVLAVYALSQRSSARHQAAIAHERQVEAEHALAAEYLAKQHLQKERDKAVAAEQHAQQLSDQNQQLATEATQQTKTVETQNEQLMATQTALTQKDAQLNATNTALDQTNTQLKQKNDQLDTANSGLRLANAKAERQRRAAVAATHQARLLTQRTRADALLERAQAELATDPAASVRDTLASDRVAHPASVESVLRTALLAQHAQAELRAGGTAAAATYSPDSSLLALGDRNGFVRLYRVASAARVAQLVNGSGSLRQEPGLVRCGHGGPPLALSLGVRESKAAVRGIQLIVLLLELGVRLVERRAGGVQLRVLLRQRGLCRHELFVLRLDGLRCLRRLRGELLVLIAAQLLRVLLCGDRLVALLSASCCFAKYSAASACSASTWRSVRAIAVWWRASLRCDSA